jgi:hypothetical protein
MAASPNPSRRPAKLSRWAASGLSAVVTVGAVGAMAAQAEAEPSDDGVALGAVARHQGELAAAALMASADPGEPAPSPIPPPRIGRANVS